MPRLRLFPLLAAVALSARGGGSAADAPPPPLVLGGIPDQDVALLEERFGGLADYLSDELGFRVRYQPATDTPRSSPRSPTAMSRSAGSAA